MRAVSLDGLPCSSYLSLVLELAHMSMRRRYVLLYRPPALTLIEILRGARNHTRADFPLDGSLRHVRVSCHRSLPRY